MAEIPEFFITKYNPKAMSGDITEQVKFNHNYRSFLYNKKRGC